MPEARPAVRIGSGHQAAWKKDNELAATLQQKKKDTPKPVAKGKEEQPSDFGTLDQAVWKRELARKIKYGDQIFHSDQ